MYHVMRPMASCNWEIMDDTLHFWKHAWLLLMSLFKRYKFHCLCVRRINKPVNKIYSVVCVDVTNAIRMRVCSGIGACKLQRTPQILNVAF